MDALLSVRRYMIGLMPGPPWRVMLAGDEGHVERPYAVVSTADGAAGTDDGPQTVNMSLPIVVHAFPPAGDRPSASKLIAQRVANALELAIRVGVVDYRDPTVRGVKQKIPLWDYVGAGGAMSMDELTSTAVLDGNPAVRRNRPDYLWVADGWKAQAIPQADSGQLFVATLEARVQWLAPTGLAITGPTLREVAVNREPTTP